MTVQPGKDCGNLINGRVIKFLTVVILLLVGMWLMVTPIYNWILEQWAIPIWLQVVLGAAIVYIGVKKFKLHPW